MPSVTDLSGYELEPIREGPDFTLYRGRQHGNSSPVLVVMLASEQPSPQGLRRLEHEYSLAVELDDLGISHAEADGVLTHLDIARIYASGRAIRIRTSPDRGQGSVISPTTNTSPADPCFSYQ